MLAFSGFRHTRPQTSYTYNPDGYRSSKTVDGIRTNHIWNGTQIVLETDETDTPIAEYIYGVKRIYNEQNGEKTYYLYDVHGDTKHLTDALGAVTYDYTYDAFGNEIGLYDSDTDNEADTDYSDIDNEIDFRIFITDDEDDAGNSDIDNETAANETYNPFRYCGEYQDLCSGLIYLRNRYYDPSIGRFISEDPIQDGLNWYVYANNNPVNYIDPWGLAPTKEEAAAMANHIYGDYDMGKDGLESRKIAGWRLIDVFDGGAASSIKLGVYIPDGDDWANPSEYALVFRGSTLNFDMETASVWANNILAYDSSVSVDMWAAIGTGIYFDATHSQEITFVGHSKGGGEAIAAATATNNNAITFNAQILIF